PISYGHTIIIPKDHIPSSDKMPNEAQLLADEIFKKIKLKLKPKDVTISSSNLFGHEILNVLPIYKNENINSKKYQAKPEELQKLQNQLSEKVESNIIKKSKIEQIDAKNIWLPKRIP
ncbi:hypothetical protein CMI40_00270, partial [Candidatus Pacearchaeota archaeon]|nr:hypothetical protein [Candidatus Pacearchaeota archaeon]